MTTRRTQQRKKPIERPRRVSGASGSFLVVGLGASAGGLEALESFFAHVPAKSGAAYVVVQHLDPNHKGMLAQLLQRATAMPVAQITGGLRVESDHVYVIPPNRDLAIRRGVLHLLEPAAPRGLRLPIDFFFRALAEDQGERSVAVVLSGMGSDGTLGIRAIKEAGGAVFVQSPESAKFDGMPRSAIDSGVADVIEPPDVLPARIAAYHQHVPTLARPPVELAQKEHGALEKVTALLRAHTGHDFSSYKRATIHRRVERRMGLHQLNKIADYARYLRDNPQETELLFKELLIGVTSFFRDPAAWDQLRDEALPALLAANPAARELRAWTAGCSTGEEAYSLAIVFLEALERIKPARSMSLQIFATDLDRDAIDRARQGVYPSNIAADVSEARLARFFVQDERGYRVRRDVREMVIFATQNLIMDPPFTKLDVLTCRNLLIYMDPELQNRLMPLFHYALNPGGILMLGSSETAGTATELFAPLPGKTRIYRRVNAARPRRERAELASTLNLPDAVAAAPRIGAPPNFQTLADRFILQRYAPAVALTNDRGDILYTSGRTGKYLEPAAGKANWNVFAMARPGLGFSLNDAFTKALRLGTPVTIHGGRVGTDGEPQLVDVTAQALTEPETLRGMVAVLFTDVSPAKSERAPGKPSRGAPGPRLKAALAELARVNEELQSTREEMQTSQEELKSANEELQSTNEELQSTNEELTTSKEEMQSMNEELQTVNQELQTKVDELSRTNNDMKNLLNSTDIATLFLDDALHVRRFTSPITSIFKLLPADAGRPITDLVSQLEYPDLVADAKQVLQSLTPRETAVATHDGRWFSVRIMPYRTLDNRIDGVVITFVNITAAKKLEAELRATEARLRKDAKRS